MDTDTDTDTPFLNFYQTDINNLRFGIKMKTIPLPLIDLNWYYGGISATILIPNLYQANTDNNLIFRLQTDTATYRFMI